MNTLGLNNHLIEALKLEGITVPTDIQKQVIPLCIKNLDVIAQSATGTGKTLAYLLPLFEKHSCLLKETQAIVLVPTHELAIQVIRQIESLSANSDNHLTCLPLIGNVNIDRQIQKLKLKPNIVVGSPGRILELIKKKRLSAHTVKSIIIDEADRLFDVHNIDNVRAIIKSTLRERQLMLFSASISNDTIKIGNEIMKEPHVIKCGADVAIPDTISHIYFTVEQRDKIALFRKIVHALNPTRAIVFVNPSIDIELVTEKLKFHKLNAESLHGNNIKLDRKNTLMNFKSGKLQLLIASDIAARGLNIPNITHIFNFNLSENPKDYLHRAGRTGRNGKNGTVISLVTPKELILLKKYARDFNINLAQKSVYNGQIVEPRKQ